MKIKAYPKSLKLQAEQPCHSVMALLESLTGEDVAGQIDAALQKFGIGGTSGQEILGQCLSCISNIEMEDDGWDGLEGRETFERYDGGKGNFSLPKASPELDVEFEATVSGTREEDKGDYYTAPWSEDHVEECEAGVLHLYFSAARDDESERAYQFDGETIWEGDVASYLNANLKRK